MVKVLTIRDPQSGTLIAEEPIQSKEDEDSALARLYRKALGPDAPEFMVITRSVWLDDREWAGDLAKNWGGRFGLAVLGPKDNPGLDKSRLVLTGVSESRPAARMEFPMDKEELESIRRGWRHDAVVPVKPGEPLHVGDEVTFYRVWTDPFGEVHRLPNPDSISVVVKEIRVQGEWAGHDLYHIAWDPEQVTVPPKKVAARRSR